MRRLNVKLLLWLGVPAVILAASVHVLWTINSDRSTQVVLEQAHHALDDGRLPEALQYFSEYLHQHPKDQKQLCHAALAAAEVAKSGKPTVTEVRYAYQLMERALRNAPERSDVRRELIQLLTRSGGFHEARNHIEQLESFGVRDVELDYLYAQCAMVDGEESVALGRLEALVGYDPVSDTLDSRQATAPDMIRAYVLLAEVLRARRAKDLAADTVMDHLVTANPENAEALLARGRYLRQQMAKGSRIGRADRRKRAKADLHKSLELAPHAVEGLLENAALAMDSDDYDAAADHLDVAMAEHPNDRRVFLLCARLAGLQNDPMAAARYYEKGLESLPDDPEMVWRLFEVRLQSADRRGAMATIDVMRTLTFPADRVTLAEAQIELLRGHWNEARKQLEAIRPQVTNVGDFSKSIDLLLGQCYEKLGQPDRQIEVFDRVLAVDANNETAQSGQVRALVRLERFDEAMARLILMQRTMGMEKFQKSVPLARLFAQLTQILDQQITNHDATDDATDNAESVSKATLLLQEAQHIAQTGGSKARSQLEALESQIATVPADQQSEVWRGLGAAYYSLAPHRTGDVKRCWTQAVALRPNDPQLLGLLLDLAIEHHDRAGMTSVLEATERTLGRSSSLWRYLQARRSVWRVQTGQAEMAGLDEAAQQIEQIAHDRPNWHLRLRLDGTIHDLQGNIGSAIDLYQKSLAVGPPHVGTVRRLVELFMVQGRTGEARHALNGLDPIPPSLQRHRVVLEAFGGDRKKALTALALAVPDDSTRPDDLMWKGHALHQLDAPDEAERAFRRAVQFGSNLPTTWLALVQHLVTSGKTTDAVQVVRDAESRVSEASANVLLARCWARIGDHKVAEHYYQAALLAQPASLRLRQSVASYYLRTAQLAKATRSLNQLVQRAEQRGQPLDYQATWARRALAAIHATEGNYLAFRKALTLLDANRDHGVLKDEDLRMKALALGARPEPRSRRQAIDLLEEIRKRLPLSFEERFLLASLYYRSGRWPECRELMLGLVTDDRQHVSVLATFVEMLVERHEADPALPWIRHLTAIQPNTLDTIRLTARLHLLRGDRQEAITIAESWLAQPDDPRHARRLWHVAQLLEQLHLYEESERRYRQLVQMDPSQRLLLAAYTMRRGKLDEAFRICESAENDDTILELCQIANIAIDRHCSRLTEDQRQTLARWIASARRQLPHSPELQTQEATFLNAIGQTDEAIRRFETMLAGNATPTQRAMTANNLAYLMVVHDDGRHAEALQLIDQAIEGLGPQIELLDTRAMIHLERGDFARARKDLEEATQFGAPTGDYYFHLALAHQGMNDRSAARRALHAAREAHFSERDLTPVQQRQMDEIHQWLLQTSPVHLGSAHLGHASPAISTGL